MTIHAEPLSAAAPYPGVRRSSVGGVGEFLLVGGATPLLFVLSWLVRRTVGQSDRVKREIEDRLRRYLHPLVGGRDGKGWAFGRAVYKTDLAHLVEDVPGVEVIDSITIFDEDKRVAVENVRLEPHELIYLVNIAVVERVREEIV